MSRLSLIPVLNPATSALVVAAIIELKRHLSEGLRAGGYTDDADMTWHANRRSSDKDIRSVVAGASFM